MKTRQATILDIPVIAELFSLYRTFYKQAQDIAGAEMFISERMKNGESVIFIVEDDLGTGIGFAQLYPSFSSVSMKRLWILNDLFVHEAHRGKSAGKFLLDACVGYAKATQAKGLTLRTAQDNFVAQKLYERHGWKKDNVYLSYNINV